MIKTLEFLAILLIGWIVTWFVVNDNKSDCRFMEYSYTDALRGIGALLIVISHVSGLTGTRVATPLGGVGVALFLICSGYGMQISYDKKGLSGFWKSKIKRVALPYWIAVILYYVINMQMPTDIYKFVGCVFLIHPLPYMWYIKYLLVINVIFYLVYKLLKPQFRNAVMIVFCIGATTLLKNDMYAEQSFSFLTGIMLAQNKEKILSKMNKNKCFFIGVGCCFVGIAFLALKQLPVVRMSPYCVFNVIQLVVKLMCALGIVLSLWKLWPKKNGGIVQIGKRSYEVYIVHTLFISLLTVYGVSFIWMSIYVCLCILSTELLHVILDRV